ncbi:hypothetical protein AAG906_018828 [Vitis piasezkii]
MEGLKTNSTTLAALAEYLGETLFLFSECDICSCLNTLRFLNKKNQTLNVVRNDVLWSCQKDMSRSIFDIWKEIDNCCNGMSNGFNKTKA